MDMKRSRQVDRIIEQDEEQLGLDGLADSLFDNWKFSIIAILIGVYRKIIVKIAGYKGI